jgi:hypothetical protein
MRSVSIVNSRLDNEKIDIIKRLKEERIKSRERISG